jgi:hypothetical protein
MCCVPRSHLAQLLEPLTKTNLVVTPFVFLFRMSYQYELGLVFCLTWQFYSSTVTHDSAAMACPLYGFAHPGPVPSPRLAAVSSHWFLGVPTTWPDLFEVFLIQTCTQPPVSTAFSQNGFFFQQTCLYPFVRFCFS